MVQRMNSTMTNEEINSTKHFTLSNGWKVIEATGHTWKWNAVRNRWENWR
jgi:hypothetical protein